MSKDQPYTLVIAGNYHQFMEWLCATGYSPKNAKYICKDEQYMGMRNCLVTACGESYLNPLYDKIDLIKQYVGDKSQ